VPAGGEEAGNETPPPRAFSPVTEETPAAAEVRLKRRTGMPAAWHSSARCEDRVVEARMMPSTR
jgi:hypothetical protein